MTRGAIDLRQLDAVDAEVWRTLRLHALAASPEAFGVSYDEEVARPLAEVASRLAAARRPDVTFGAFLSGALVGCASFSVMPLRKMRHKGLVTGLFVHGEARGRGIARALMAAVLDHAAAHVEIVHCSVVTDNASARRLYHAIGFKPFALEPCGLKIDGRCFDEEHLYLRVGRGAPEGASW